MPRPKCCRRVGAMPDRTCFRPQGGTKVDPCEVRLSIDEFEAIRLADLEGLYQEEAASLMKVSRQTFGRIVAAARGKLADVLVNGKVLRIEGGPVSIEASGRPRCPRCHHSLGLDGGGAKTACPHCQKHQSPREGKGETK